MTIYQTLLTIAPSLQWWQVSLMALVAVLSVMGIVGAVLPALPGTPLNIVALVIAYFICPGQISTQMLIALIAAGVIVTILDFVAPIWFTQAGGGSKRAIWGSSIGLVAGLFFMPTGLIVGPLIGAFLGELSEGKHAKKALKVSLWSFAAFVITTGLKLMAGIVISYYCIAAIYAQIAT